MIPDVFILVVIQFSIFMSGVFDKQNAVFPSMAIDEPILSSSIIFNISSNSGLINFAFSENCLDNFIKFSILGLERSVFSSFFPLSLILFWYIGLSIMSFVFNALNVFVIT